MNFNHLRYFWEVARDGNLTRTAERLNLSQSAVSIQIKKLEERLGHALFERRGRQLHLTEAGRIALDHADTIFSAGRDLLSTLSQTGNQRRILRVGALATLSRNFQIAFLEPLLGAEDVELVLRSGSSIELFQSLETLSLDIVLTNRIPDASHLTGFTIHPISEQPVSVIGAPERLQGAQSLAELLSAHPVIVPTPESPVRIGFDGLCAKLGVTPVFAAEVDDMAMMRLLARADAGLAILPPIVVRDELLSGRLKEASHVLELTESFHAVTVKRQFPNPLVARLLDQDV